MTALKKVKTETSSFFEKWSPVFRTLPAGQRSNDQPQYDREVVEPQTPVFKRTVTDPSVETLKKASQRKNAYAEIPPELV